MVELTVIVPTYQRRSRVVECVRALLDQSIAPELYEIVVVVDGSTDGTVDALHALGEAERLRVEERANEGSARARNTGLHLAAGRWIVFVDDDVTVERSCLAEHLGAQRSGDGVLAIGKLHTAVRDDADGMTRAVAARLNAHFTGLDAGTHVIDALDCWSGNMSAPTGAMRALGGFDAGLAEEFDADLGYRLAAAGILVVYVPAARGEQLLTSTAGDLLRDAQAHGRAMVELVRKHHARGEQVSVGDLTVGGRRRARLLRLLLASRLSPGALARPARLLDRTGWSAKVARLQDQHAFWYGVRAASGGRAHWRSLLSGTGARDRRTPGR